MVAECLVADFDRNNYIFYRMLTLQFSHFSDDTSQIVFVAGSDVVYSLKALQEIGCR